MSLKKTIRKLTPGWIISIYHYCLAVLAAKRYRYPSRDMIVIGVTGTKGKTTAANYIWQVLQSNGIKTGIVSTANIRVGDKERMNKFHMTMPGRFALQELLAEMKKAKCRYVVVEVTSEGIKQWRHKGIDFDIAVFTNLTPEHLQSHGGSFEKYKAAKGKLFKGLSKCYRKEGFDKWIIVNDDDKNSDYYLGFEADRKTTFGGCEKTDFEVDDVEAGSNGVEFELNDDKYELSIPGAFNVSNAVPAIIIGLDAGLSRSKIAKALKSMTLIPGRIEEIDEGQDFRVFVDYAHEKEGMQAVANTARSMTSSKTIILLGAEGGGRDTAKRSAMGKIVGRDADIVVVSNVDPYDDDPTPIVEDIAKAAENEGKKRGKDLFAIEDRREGIARALEAASKGDVVIITGKGAEQSITIGGKKMPWDDRKVVREEIAKLQR